ncbi:hypothetical protein HGRIS_001452 [Hohenbuehelia grisea]|uniref:Transposase Tc1-like domain-containing protein n=1 Tax=Hohenbuehelia grisea TaxID=104357 RepID=A0ABR3IZI4_9AGAR
MLVRNARKHRRAPFTELANSLQLDVSESTICRTLAGEGYHRRVARRRPFLTKVQKQGRMRWAREYMHWDEDDWGGVEFSVALLLVSGLQEDMRTKSQWRLGPSSW